MQNDNNDLTILNMFVRSVTDFFFGVRSVNYFFFLGPALNISVLEST